MPSSMWASFPTACVAGYVVAQALGICSHPELVNGSPLDLGWEKKGNIEPIMYEGKTTAEMISGLTWNCKGRKRCKVDCSCYVNSLPCIDLCLCESEENKCHNPTSFNNEEIEEDISQD